MLLACGRMLMVAPRDVWAGSRQEAVANRRAVVTGVVSLVLSPRARPSPISRVLPWAVPLTWGSSARSDGAAVFVSDRRRRRQVRNYRDRKSTRLNSSHVAISYAVFCLKKKKNKAR